MSDFLEFGFGQNDEKMSTRVSKFKMREGETARISFAWWPMDDDGNPDFTAPTPKFIGGNTHYIEGVGRVVHGGPEFTEIAGKSPKFRIMTVIIRWPTTPSGAVDADRLKSGHWSAEIWDFTKFKYGMLKPIHEEWGFADHDLKCTCTEGGFQSMSFIACKDSLLKKLQGKPMFDSIMSAVKSLAEQVPDELGRKMTANELRQRIAQGGSNSSGGRNSGGSRPASRAPAESSGEPVDNMIDGFLDEL